MISIKNITKKFGDNKVIDSLSLEIKKGSITIIKGNSGIGKTTFFRILLGLTPYDEGVIKGLPNKISALFQEDRLIENLSVKKNIYLALKEKENNSLNEKIIKNLEAVGLYNIENKKASKLSQGMKRRVSFIRTMMKESDLIAFDEPFRSVDEENSKLIAKFIKEHQNNKTLIIFVHDERYLKDMTYTLINLNSF